jgi:RNA polymerase sigma-70 factor (ECF subfamily)
MPTRYRETAARRGDLPSLEVAVLGGGGNDDVTRQAIARAQEGDRAAAEYCYIRFAGEVRRYVRSIVHNAHDAEDVTQNVFMKLFGCLERYDESRAPFSAWLLRIARNAALDHLRQRRAVPCDELAARRSAVAKQDPDASATLRDAFETLPDQQRLVLFLRHVLGLSPDEIAHELGRTPASVNGLQHRGRGALKAALRRAEMTPATAPSVRRRRSSSRIVDSFGKGRTAVG